MRFLRSLWIWAVIAVATIVFGVLAVPLSFVPPRGSVFMTLARGWSRVILQASGVRVRVLHPERLDPRQSAVIAPNHESFYDIMTLFSVMPEPIGFLAKRNLFRLPFLGWAMAAAGFVPVDRGARRRGTATVDTAMRRLQRGRSLVVFPEETRTRTGDLLPFKAGAALLAIRSGLPLLPVGIGGTFRIQRRGGFTIRSSDVAVAIGEPIDAGGLSIKDRGALTETLRRRVEELRNEARAAVTYNFEPEAG